MKIQCDVCEKDEASVFCIADEAALCAACDHRVHHANKLAGKHQRFSLHHPSPKQAPLCDICQERRAFLFCQQDRAILCRECDIPIHKANEHTQKHTRFLLTGIKLSATSNIYSESPSSTESASSSLTNNNNNKSSEAVSNKPVCIIAPTSTPSNAKGTTVQSATVTAPIEKSNNVELMNFNGSISASSISEYLEMVPGWHVEDFLDSSSSPSPFGFSKNGENDLLPFWDHADLNQNTINMSAFTTEKIGISVPQVQPLLQQTQNQTNQSIEISFGFGNGFMEQSKEFISYNNTKSSRKRNEDNSFAVPQISPSFSHVSKRSRNFYQ